MDEKKWFPKLRNNSTKEIMVDGERFVYRFETGGDQNEWLDHFMIPVYDEDGKILEFKRSLSKQNKCLLMNVEEVPFDKMIIGKLLGTEPKEWKGLSREERVSVLKEVNPSLFSQLINKIRKEEEKDDDKKKS